LCFTSFGLIWAWIDYSWFASAYDTDDWLYRLLTMVQIIGVVIFTLGMLVTPIELAGPAVAERGTGTPWHAHHIVERRGLLTIITIGEIVTGTVLTLPGIKDTEGQGIDWTGAVLVAISGRRVRVLVGVLHPQLRCGAAPSPQPLVRVRVQPHFLIWPVLAAVGGGLHVMTQAFENVSGMHVDPVVAAAALAVPVGVFVLGLFLAYYFTTQLWAGLHTAILALALVVLGFAVFLAAHGVSLAVVLAICTIVPWIMVIAFELFAGAQHEAHVLESRGVEGHEVDGRRADVS